MDEFNALEWLPDLTGICGVVRSGGDLRTCKKVARRPRQNLTRAKLGKKHQLPTPRTTPRIVIGYNTPAKHIPHEFRVRNV